MFRNMTSVGAGLLALLSFASRGAAQSCSSGPVAVQVLGSGGPWQNRERASTSYLVWVDGHAKVLVDIGGGAFLRFGQAQAKLGDLALVAISHLHPDHVSDLPALLWLSNQSRTEPLAIVGPSGNDLVPAFPTFLSRLFDAKTGAFQVLGTTLGASPAGAGGGVRLDVGVADVTSGPTTVLDREGLTVTALGIPHGNIPTLAYRIRIGSTSIVFSSDQTGADPKFIDFARGANILVMHLALAAGTTSPLHASPAVVGRIAQEAGVGRLIVSHLGLFDLDAAVADVKKYYQGPLTVAADLQCTTAAENTAPDGFSIASRALGEARPVNLHTPPGYIATDSAIAPRVGGSAAFRRFIREELIPAVDSRYRTTAERGIVGESLAGLFVMETLLLEPSLFSHYVALDPSIWWNAGALVDSAAARLAGFNPTPRTLFFASSNVPEMIVGTSRLAALLRARPPKGLNWVYLPRPDLTHATIFHGLESAALASALR